jgi:hypothetical protein
MPHPNWSACKHERVEYVRIHHSGWAEQRAAVVRTYVRTSQLGLRNQQETAWELPAGCSGRHTARRRNARGQRPATYDDASTAAVLSCGVPHMGWESVMQMQAFPFLCVWKNGKENLVRGAAGFLVGWIDVDGPALLRSIFLSFFLSCFAIGLICWR